MAGAVTSAELPSAPQVVAAARRAGGFAPHGNYQRYYGYRLGQAFELDPRLGSLRRGWFHGRRCMDVGCNEGVVTLALVQTFRPRSMVGVDLDERLVRRACTTLRALRASASARDRAARAPGVDAGERRGARDAALGLSRTWFLHADFVEAEVEPVSLDTLTCLSVTKWVHLNRGDEGLRTLFSKFWDMLVPGGLLILEPQPWSSYKTAVNKLKKQAKAVEGTPAADALPAYHALEDLVLRPDKFDSYLCDTLGFRVVRRILPTEAATGFQRGILVLRKPQAAPVPARVPLVVH